MKKSMGRGSAGAAVAFLTAVKTLDLEAAGKTTKVKSALCTVTNPRGGGVKMYVLSFLVSPTLKM